MRLAVEWSSMQQLGFLLKSMVLGCCIGCVLDISGGIWRGKKHRHKMYVSDVVCCILAAVITFFGALVITDGQLHPVLFAGIIFGVIAEHFVVGRWLSLFVYKFLKQLRALAPKMVEKCVRLVQLLAVVVRNIGAKGRKRAKNQ